MKNPNPKLLLYIAMADAYGMATEYIKPWNEEDKRVLEESLLFERYVKNPRAGSPVASQYTDDTEMSIANCTVLLSKSKSLSRLDFANEYVKEFNFGGRRKGYSRKFQEILESVKTGEELLAVLKPTSEKNGAAMRAVPFGVIKSTNTLLNTSSLSASVTHDTEIGLFSSRAISLAAHYSFYDSGPLSAIREYILDNLPKEDAKFQSVVSHPWDGTPVVGNSMGPVGLTTVAAVLTLVATKSSLMEMLRTAMVWGGDVDSVASIAWGIASSRMQDEALPIFFEESLEMYSNVTGSKRLCAISKELMQRSETL